MVPKCDANAIWSRAAVQILMRFTQDLGYQDNGVSPRSLTLSLPTEPYPTYKSQSMRYVCIADLFDDISAQPDSVIVLESDDPA